LTQEQLGERLSDPRSKGMISQWEKGTTTPTLEQLVEIARELHTDQSWVAFGTGSSTIPISGTIISGGLAVETPQEQARVAIPPAVGGQSIQLHAWRVKTDGIPSLHVDDVVFVAGTPGQDPSRAIGHDALVELSNGQTVFRRVEMSQKPGCINLVDHRGTVMADVVPAKLWIVVSIMKASAVEQLREIQ
jgi:transcriptional regulator with XRE-family HTH domain